jgi:hypothetical protein
MERRDEHDGAITRARWQLQGLVLELAREAFGDSIIERRARHDGDQFSERAPAPLAGAWAAHQLWRCARGEMVSQVRRARESGHSWEEIGRTLEFTPDDGRTVAEAAFEQMTGLPSPGRQKARRSCGVARLVSACSPTVGRTSTIRPTMSQVIPRIASGWPARSNAGAPPATARRQGTSRCQRPDGRGGVRGEPEDRNLGRGQRGSCWRQAPADR